MSYRELRAFTEKMRCLGYPRLISMESFRMPNFELVSDVLLWLVRNYDPNLDIPDDTGTEQERVMFIKSVATYMATKAHIKLNTRKLYMADGYVVKELLKIANVLYEASTTKASEEEDIVTVPPLDISSKIPQLKTCRLLATEITERGATLYDLLGKEMELRDIRTAVISRPFDLRTMETAVSESITNIQDQIATTRAAMENLATDEMSLMAKIEKKKMDLERAEKRLKSLAGVRPAYMDEYEKIEVELARLYEVYMEKFRNLTYLEQQLDEYNRQEQDKFEETEMTLKQMQSRLREEELRLLRGDKEMRAAIGGYGGAESARPKRPNAAGRRSQSLILRSDSESDGEERSDVDESEDVSMMSDEGDNEDDLMMGDDDGGQDLDDLDDVGEDDDHIIVDNDDEDEEGSLGDDDQFGDGGMSGDDNDF